MHGGRNTVGDFLRNGKSEKCQKPGMGKSSNLVLVIQIDDAKLSFSFLKSFLCFLSLLPSFLPSLLTLLAFRRNKQSGTLF